MIKVIPGEEKAVYNEIKIIPGVRDVFHVFGEYDFITIIDVGSLSEVNKTVDTIRENDMVTETQTIIGAEL